MEQDLKYRSLQLELMDAPLGLSEKYDGIIRQIERVNALTGGYRPILAWLEKQLSVLEEQPITIVDLGCGRGSLLREIARHLRGRKIRLLGVDNNSLAIEAARKATPEDMAIEYHLADIFTSDELLSADFIVCSHTAHHMTDGEIINLLRLLERKAKHGWFICDLHRHWVAYLFVRGILSLLPVDPMVAHDGPLSVCRAFKQAEWQKLICEAGLSSPVQVEWYFPFRYGLFSKRMCNEKIQEA